MVRNRIESSDIEPTPDYPDIYLLPWLDCPREAYSFGKAHVTPLSELSAPNQQVAAKLLQIAGRYHQIGGQPVDPLIFWLGDSGPFSSSSNGLALREHLWCLALSMMAENHYNSPNDPAPVNWAHFEMYRQGYNPNGDHITLRIPRRDGTNTSMWRIDDLDFVAPLSAIPHHQTYLNYPLLESLAAGIGTKQEPYETILEALPFFVMGNRLSDTVPILYDLVWMGGAFERLLPMNGHGKTQMLVEGLDNVLAKRARARRTKCRKYNPQTRQVENMPCSWLERWAREFYAHRSEIHADPALSHTWGDREHCLIASIVFCLCVKSILEKNGVYSMTASDIAAMKTLEEEIMFYRTGKTTNEARDKLLHDRSKAELAYEIRQALAGR